MKDRIPHQTSTKLSSAPESQQKNSNQSKSLKPSNHGIQFTIQKKNNTGLPDHLKSGIEHMSGISMDDVKVHYNSSQPKQLNAHAYAQGNQIHFASGQEKHLPHEAWHVVQQKQGRVKATQQLKGNVSINDDKVLEQEADVMGEKAAKIIQRQQNINAKSNAASSNVVQLQLDIEQIHRLTYITDVDELIDWISTELSNDEDIQDAINGWLLIYPKFKDNKVEIFSRAGQLSKLNKKQKKAAKKILLGSQTDTEEDKPIPKEEIDEKILDEIINHFKIYASKTIKQVRSSDKSSINLGPESPEDNILQRAIETIFKKHGQTIQFGIGESKKDATVARDNLEGATLHHSSDRWTHANAEAKSNAAKMAIEWLLTNEPSIYSNIEALHETVHKQSSISTIVSTYSKTIFKDEKNKELLETLAEIRLNWSPITYGSKIYISVKKVTKAKQDQWELYKNLIHEAIHAAENPAFARFLDRYIPNGLHSDLREGITEYLTLEIWDEVIEAAKILSEEKISLPGDDPLVPLKETEIKLKEIVKGLEKDTSYHLQVATIKKIIAAIDNGANRLEAAYFAGNVAAFLPKSL